MFLRSSVWVSIQKKEREESKWNENEKEKKKEKHNATLKNIPIHENPTDDITALGTCALIPNHAKSTPTSLPSPL